MIRTIFDRKATEGGGRSWATSGSCMISNLLEYKYDSEWPHAIFQPENELYCKFTRIECRIFQQITTTTVWMNGHGKERTIVGKYVFFLDFVLQHFLDSFVDARPSSYIQLQQTTL